MAYVEVRKGEKLVTRRLVDDAEAMKGCRIRLGSAGKVILKIGQSKVVGKYEVSVHEGMPSDDAHKAVDGLSKSGDSFPEMSATETASMEDIPATKSGASRSARPVIEGYQIVGRLGEGGMGTVWRAVQLSTKREVALKFMGRHRFASDKARARFEREVALAAKLTHPNIARVYHSGIHRGVYYYAMELVDGVHLDKYVQQNLPTQQEILELTERICEAIQHAHKKGIIHRDLKPSNILVTSDGQPHVVDFGLAKASEKSESDMTISIDGELAGTLAYMAPEQAAGRMDQISVRTDVYSLGVILYRLVTGESPHDLSGSRYDTIKNIVEDEIVPPRELNPAIDADLEWLILTALEKEPENRYPSAGVLRQDIQNYLQGGPLLARSMSTTYLIRKGVRKRAKPIAKVAALLAVMVAAIAIAYYVGGAKRGPQHPDAGLGPPVDTQPPAERLSSSAGAIDAVEPGSDQGLGVSTVVQAGPTNQQMWSPTRSKAPSAILIDGKPFFVICARSAMPEELVEYKRAGFNTVSTHDCDDLALDEAHDNGLWAIARLPWYRLPGTWGHLKDNTMTDSDWLEFENRAKQQASSAGLLAWALPTNPAGKGMQPNDVRRAYQILKKYSPNKPGFLLFSVKSLVKSQFDQYGPHSNALAIECYPQNNIKVVATSTDKLVSLGNGKPAWVLVQANKCGGFTPSNDQFRSMAYLAVNHGASGIFVSGFKSRLWEEWGSTDVLGLNDPQLSGLRNAALQLAGELNQLSPAILAGPLADEVSLVNGNDAIDMKAYASPSNDTLYIVAVNTSTVAVTQRFRIPTTMAAKIQVLGESRVLSHSNGEFTDVFASHETHVYVLQPQGSSSIGQPAGAARAIPPSSAVSETLPEGLVLYYSFDTRAVNNDIADLSGLGNHGTLEGAEWTPNGRIGGAYSFNITHKSDRIRVPDSDSLDCSYVTIAAWIKTVDDDEYWNRILDKDWRDGYNLCLGGGSKGNEYRGKVVFEMHSQGVRSKNVVADGTWHHVAGTFDGREMKLYVDGSLHDSKTCRTPIPANSWDIGIGNEHPLYDKDEFLAFDGLIDEIMLFNRALSQQEVTGLYARAGADQVAAPRRKRILFFSQSMQYEHDVIKRPSNRELSYAEKAFERIARDAGYDVVFSKDAADLSTESKFDQFDAIVFYTTKSPPINKTAMLSWLRSGRAFIGIHSACDSYYDWPEYVRILGGYFDGHGGHERPVTMKVEKPNHPSTDMLSGPWEIADEIYQLKDFSRANVNVLLSVDTDRMSNSALIHHKMRRGQNYPVAWTNTYDQGRIFYTGLGHLESVWDDPLFQQHLLGGIKWALGEAGVGLSAPVPHASFVDPGVSSRLLAGNIGFLKIERFNNNTPNAVRKALETFVTGAARGAILDLRGSRGGTILDAGNVADVFVPEGRILWFSKKRNNRGEDERQSRQPAVMRTPVAVLIDGSAGHGCELVAAAIQRNKLGAVLGQRTGGTTADMNPGSKIKSYFYLEEDLIITGRGLDPDIQIPADATEQQWLDAAIQVIRNEPAGASDHQSDWVELFNGRDLTGWTGNTRGHLAGDGLLIVDPTRGKGNLYTVKEYGDFTLRFEFKLSPGANNGIGIRTPLTGGPAYKGMEIQILDDMAPEYAKIRPEQHHGSIFKVVPAKPGHLKPAGQWNSQEISAIGPQITVVLNGTTILDKNIEEIIAPDILKSHPGLRSTRGRISLCEHGDYVEFRNMKIKALDLRVDGSTGRTGSPSPGLESEWVQLFNGRDLTGWKPRGGKARFEVNNGAIVGTTVQGTPNSFLCTEGHYSNFELEFEVRIDQNLNSGVQMRSNSLPGYKNGQVHGYQVEIDAARSNSGFIYDEGRRGWLSTDRSDQEAQRAFKATQWNKMRVLCNGDLIKTWVNGIPVADLRDSMTPKGFIALQVHRYDGPRPARVYFRNIRVKEL